MDFFVWEAHQLYYKNSCFVLSVNMCHDIRFILPENNELIRTSEQKFVDCNKVIHNMHTGWIMTPLNIMKESDHLNKTWHHNLNQINDAIINIYVAFYLFSWLLTLHLWLLTLHGYSRYAFGTPAVQIWTHAPLIFGLFSSLGTMSYHKIFNGNF